MAATIIRALNGLIVVKIMATHSSVGDFGKISQIMGVIAMCSLFAAGGIGSGLSRNLAAARGIEERHRWLTVALRVSVISTLCIAVALILCSLPLSLVLLDDSAFIWLFIFLAISQALVGASTVAQAVAVADRAYSFILKVASLSAILGALCVLVGISFAGLLGGVYALLINSAMSGIVSLLLKKASVRRLIAQWRAPVAKSDAINLLKYAAVTLTGAASLIISQLAGRNAVGATLGWEVVGLWQAAVKISDVYMQLISTVLMGFVLPKLSASVKYREMHLELMKILRVSIFLFIFLASVLYFARSIVVGILFDSNFSGASHLIGLQLIGDFFRVIAVTLSVGMLATGATRLPIMFEGAQGVLTFLLTIGLINTFANLAPLVAYAVCYMLLACILSFFHYQRLSKEGVK